MRLHTQGEDFLKETHFLRRGDPNQKEGGRPAGLSAGPDDRPATAGRRPPPKGSQASYRRSAFADWMTDVEHGAGPLLARVIVNRLWQHHLGRGIVATPSDFGVRGERPTHPELLDCLASELIRNGWRLKPIHRLIVTSAVYQQDCRSSRSTRQGVEGSIRDNTLFWRQPGPAARGRGDPRRAAGRERPARPTMYGPGTLDEASRRRSIYFTVKRSRAHPDDGHLRRPRRDGRRGRAAGDDGRPAGAAPDEQPAGPRRGPGPSRTGCVPRRRPPERGDPRAYRLALSRDATADELADGPGVRRRPRKRPYAGRADARELAMADFCQVVMCLNEFIYME